MLTMINKELKSYFNSATAYIFMGIILFIAGIFYTLNNVLASSPEFSSVISGITFIFIFVIPIITMKTLSDERKNRTDQLLLTSPQSITGIVLGKYFAAVILYFLTLIITMLLPLMLSFFGTVPMVELFAIYMGVFFVGCCFIAVGIFISSLTENVVVAAVGSMGAILCIWIIDWIKTGLPSSMTSGIIFAIILVLVISYIIFAYTGNIYSAMVVLAAGLIIIAVIYFNSSTTFEGLIGNFIGWFSIIERHQPFTLGIISLNSILYFISFSFIFVFLTIRMIDKKRWN